MLAGKRANEAQLLDLANTAPSIKPFACVARIRLTIDLEPTHDNFVVEKS